MADSIDPRVQSLVDRESIRDVVFRYCHSIDRGDFDLLNTVYWPDATEKHASFNGPAADFIEIARKMLAAQKGYHIVGNSLIRLNGDSANAETYVFAYLEIKAFEEGDMVWAGRPSNEACELLLMGRYVDQFERRGDEWRIAARVVAYDWWRFLEGAFDPNIGLEGAPLEFQGRYQPDDIASKIFAGDDLKVLVI